MLPVITGAQERTRDALADVILTMGLFVMLVYYVEPMLLTRMPHVGGHEPLLALAALRGASSIVALALLIVLTSANGVPLHTVGLSRCRTLAFIGWVVGGVGACIVFSYGFGALLWMAHHTMHFRLGSIREASPLEGAAPPARLGLLLLGAFTAAFEESVFRGILISRLRRLFGRWLPAVLLSALVAGIWHYIGGNIQYAATAAVGAVVLSVLFIASGNLLVVMCVHSIFNGLQVMLVLWNRS